MREFWIRGSLGCCKPRLSWWMFDNAIARQKMAEQGGIHSHEHTSAEIFSLQFDFNDYVRFRTARVGGK